MAVPVLRSAWHSLLHPSLHGITDQLIALAMLGAWGGWQILPLTILLSSLVGAVLGVILLRLRGSDSSTPIPFGPYLAIAGWIALLWGDVITGSYLKFAGF